MPTALKRMCALFLLSKLQANKKFGNLVGNSLIGICLTLPNLGVLWIFFKYPKISKIGNSLFFPVIIISQKSNAFESSHSDESDIGGIYISFLEKHFSAKVYRPCSMRSKVSRLPLSCYLCETLGRG